MNHDGSKGAWESTMDPVTAIFLLILMFGVLRRSRENKGKIDDAPSSLVPFENVPFLLSKQEEEFLDLLKSVVVGRYIIHIKVSIKSLLQLKKYISESAKAGYWKKIHTHCADFVLCEPDTLKVVCVINLEKREKSSKENQKNEKVLKRVFKEASLPLVHFKTNYKYDENEVLAALSSVVGIDDSRMRGNV